MVTRPRIFVLTALLFSLGCVGEVEEANDRGPAVTLEPIIGGVLASSYPEAAYLNIDATATSMYVCSGSLIAPRVVLTAGHCVDGHSKWEVHVAGAYRLATRSAVYDWYENGSDTVNPKHHDIGLVFLNEAVNLPSYPTIASSKAAENAPVTCVGRVDDGVVMSGAYQADTQIVSGDSLGYPFAYRSAVVIQKGDSGGPVFAKDTHHIVAVNSGANSTIQVLARVDLLSTWIDEKVKAEGGSIVGLPSGGGGASSTNGGATSYGGVSAFGGNSGATKETAVAEGGSKSSTTPGGATSRGGTSGTAKGSGAAPSTNAPASCPSLNEVEPNNSFSAAKNLPQTLCANLPTKTDVDWFTVTMPVGRHQLTMRPSLDAVMNVGVKSRSSCVISYRNARAINVNVTGNAATLCVQVISPGKRPQAYQVVSN